MNNGGLSKAKVDQLSRRQAAVWFARLHADDVTHRDHEDFQRWLATDTSHQTAYTRLESLWADLGAHADHPELDDRLQAVKNESIPAALDTRRASDRSRRAWLASTALVVLAIAAGMLFWTTPRGEVMHYATDVGEQRTLTLADGSQVTLDTQTQVSVAFTAAVRKVTLVNGRAFFRVAKDPRRPFLVSAQDGTVRAVGTQFDVFSHGDVVEVTLIEGRVVVTRSSDGKNLDAAPTTMQAGQRLFMGKAYPKSVLKPTPVDIKPAWIFGHLEFNDTPLPKVVSAFNRYSTSKIIIRDSATAQLHISGVFRSHESDAFVEALRTSYGLRVHRNADGNLVLASSSRIDKTPK